MKIVIDIPEEVYKSAKNGTLNEIQSMYICGSVVEGTPLPKGHGRIIDYGYVVGAIDDWVNAEEYRYTNATDYLRKRIANTPTIIEADKEAENESLL